MLSIKNISVCVLMVWASYAFSQRGYQKDSLQIKVYTNLVMNDQIQLDTITVKKVFCNYCTEQQLEAIGNQSLAMTYDMRLEPKYQKKGEHRIAIYIRIPKDKFEELNYIDQK